MTTTTDLPADYKPWPALWAMVIGFFMILVDNTIVSVATPAIAHDLHADVNSVIWVTSAYLLAYAVPLLVTGRLGDRFGPKNVYLIGLTIFTLASLWCGLTGSIEMLIIARVVQGVGASLMTPQTMAVITRTFAPANRGSAMALWGATAGVATLVGPILGGVLVDAAGWEWIFFINVPIGIFVSFVVANQLRGRPEKLDKPRMDYVGLATLVVGVGALQILLDLGNDEDWFNSTRIVVLAIVAVIALAVFFIWELTDSDPIVDLRLFRHRNFAAGTIALVLAYAAFFAVALIIPLWLQRNLGYTAIWAGLATAPIGVLPVLLTPFVGKYATRFDLRIVASLAFIAMAATSFARAGFNLDVDFQHVAMVQLWMGLGVALFFMPVLTILLSDLAPHEIASGSGVATFFRTLGGSFAASLTTWAWNQRSVIHHAQLTEHISASDPVIHQTVEALGQGDLQRGALVLDHMIFQQAAQIGFNEIFYLLGILFIVVIGFVWFAKPPFTAKLGGGAAAGGH